MNIKISPTKDEMGAEAAKLGAWVCGRSAEIALRDGGASQESLRASDVIDRLGTAFDDLRRNPL